MSVDNNVEDNDERLVDLFRDTSKGDELWTKQPYDDVFEKSGALVVSPPRQIPTGVKEFTNVGDNSTFLFTSWSGSSPVNRENPKYVATVRTNSNLAMPRGNKGTVFSSDL